MKILSITVQALTAVYATCFSREQVPLSTSFKSISYRPGSHRFRPSSPQHVAEKAKDEDLDVDLGYAIHRPRVNDDADLFEYTNIRYATAPEGKLRFSPPIPPTDENRTVNMGDDSKICIQAITKWMPRAGGFIQDWINPLVSINETEWVSPPVWDNNPQLPAQDSRASEDCLFLDVFVPRPVFENKANAQVPVIIWIHGGGFIYGFKHQMGSPAGLINQSKGGFVFVAINYRLGALGWLGGQAYEADGGTPNLGLLDQRRAMEWVQEFIEEFGGDPSKVTVMGESAGASSILHHLTAPEPPLFSQAVLQSPAFFPQIDEPHLEKIYENFLQAAGNKASLEDLRDLKVEDLISVNGLTSWRSPYGSFTYGPTVGGDYVPQLPGIALLQDNFHSDINIMVGYNSDEGVILTPPYIQNDTALESHINNDVFPGAPAGFSTEVLKLYPLPGDQDVSAARPYINRVSAIVADAGIVCNALYLDRAYNNNTWAYRFNVYPGIHGQDVGYIFYPSDPDTAEPIDPKTRPYAEIMATRMQQFITNFAITGNPNEGPSSLPLLLTFPQYGIGRRLMEYYAIPSLVPGQALVQNARQATDGLNETLCEWWRALPYAPYKNDRDMHWT